MMRKLAALFVLIWMLLGAATAFAGVCPACGAELGDVLPEACPQCGAETEENAAAEEPAAQGPEFVMYQHEDGVLYLFWDADGVTEYRIHYFPMQNYDIRMDMTESNLVFAGEDTNSNGRYACGLMVPGKAYWVGVFDADGQGEYIPFIPEEEPASFTACKVEAQADPVLRGEKDIRLDGFSDYMLDVVKEDSVGLNLTMTYENSGIEKEVLWQIVMECPNGTEYVSALSNATLEANTESTLGWSFYDLAKDLQKLRSAFGSIPSGEYKVSFYLNGQHAASAAFDVAANDTLAGHAEIYRGLLNFTWRGGTAPFTVAYYLQSSDDAEMDGKAASDAGFYHVHEEALDARETVLDRLVPGEKYWLVVTDAEGERSHISVQLPSDPFTSFETQLLFSSSPVEADTTIDTVTTDYENGMYLGCVYDNPGEACDVLLQTVFDCGNGQKTVGACRVVTIENGKNCLQVGYNQDPRDLGEALVEDASFTLDQDIVVSVYLNGMLAGQTMIPVDLIKPEPELKLVAVNQNNGAVTIAWEGGFAPYQVHYTVKRSDDFVTDTENAQGMGRLTAVSECMETSFCLTNLIPGQAYWLDVTYDEGRGKYVGYVPGAVSESSLKNIRTTLITRDRINGVYTDLSCLPVKTAGRQDSTEHGVYFAMGYDYEGATDTMLCQIALTLPNGARYCIFDSPARVKTGTGNSLFGQWVSFESFLSDARERFGSLTAGDILMDVYLNGDFVVQRKITLQ